MTFYSKLTMPDSQRYPWNLNLIKNVEDTVFFRTQKVFIFVSFFIASFKKKCARYFRRKTSKENKQFKETKTWKSNSYLIRQSLQGYRCESAIANFAGWATLNYTYSSFKKLWLISISLYTIRVEHNQLFLNIKGLRVSSSQTKIIENFVNYYLNP